MQPGIIGQRVNEILAPYGRKFAPDPASVKSAMVGGIVMNNASGMNCGTHANSDKVLLSARIVLADGTVLDTGDDISRASFEATHPDFYNRICELRDQIRANEELAARIRYKYSIKNVTGLNLLPFIRFDDPFDIIAHLMVGSEGTLAFLSQITMRTEYDYPHKASAMLYFTSIKDACRAVVAMKELTNRNSSSVSSADEKLVKGAELLDYKSLSSVEDPVYLKYKQEVADASGLTAVLTETKARTREELEQNISVIEECLKPFSTYIPVHFTDRPEEYSKYWAIRSGIFPSVGGTRQPGTTCLIEDVAFHIEDLPEAMVLRRDLDGTGTQVHDGLVASMMSVAKLLDLSTGGDGEHLVAEANAKDRKLSHELPRKLVGIDDCLGIPRSVGKKDAVGGKGEHVIQTRVPRHDRDIAPMAAKPVEYACLDAAIEGDDMMARGAVVCG